MLLLMFVRTIKIGNLKFDNVPSHPGKLRRFQELARKLFQCREAESEVVCEFDSLDLGVDIWTGTESSYEMVLAMDQGGYRIRNATNASNLQSPEASAEVLESAPTTLAPADHGQMTEVKSKESDAAVTFSRPRVEKYIALRDFASEDHDGIDIAAAMGKCPLYDNGRLFRVMAQGQISSTKDNCVIHLRSPEAILYYLGEIARIQLDPDTRKEWVTEAEKAEAHWKNRPPNVYVSTRKLDCYMPLFRIERRTKANPLELELEYGGKTYTVPKDFSISDCGPSRSFHALSLISQLFSLQKKPGQFPVTPTVAVTGSKGL
jgi:hypothetical protein